MTDKIMALHKVDWQAGDFLVCCDSHRVGIQTWNPNSPSFLVVFPESLPFPICKSGEAGSRGDGGLGLDLRGLSFPQKGITKQQEEGIRMVERVMVSLEGEDGLDEIYSFR